jgi:integrase
MATVFKMPDRPFWFYQITGAAGVRLPRISTKTTSKREAKKMAEDAEAAERKRAKEGNVKGRAFARVIENASRLADEGKLTLEQSEKMIRELRQIANPTFKDTALGDYWRDWNKRREMQVAKSTADNYKGALKKWEAVAPDMMKLPLMELDVRHIHDGLVAMQTGENAIATTTAANYVSALKEVLDSAIEERLISSNPARSKALKKVRKQTSTKGKEKVGPFTLDEVRALMGKATEEWRGMILFGFHTGLRMMDIATLGEVNVDGAELVRTSAKTSTQTRTPLHPQLVTWLKGRRGDFFPKIRTMSNTNVSTTFSSLMKKAGVARDALLPGGEKVKRSFHSLRHTFTSVLANADVNKEVRMKLTGQSTSAVHANYTHHDSATLSAAIAKLPTL